MVTRPQRRAPSGSLAAYQRHRDTHTLGRFGRPSSSQTRAHNRCGDTIAVASNTFKCPIYNKLSKNKVHNTLLRLNLELYAPIKDPTLFEAVLCPDVFARETIEYVL
jgi:hypothetical protein